MRSSIEMDRKYEDGYRLRGIEFKIYELKSDTVSGGVKELDEDAITFGNMDGAERANKNYSGTAEGDCL